MTTSGSGSKRKYAPSVLERLHGRAEVENMHILLDSSNSSIGKSHSAVRLSSSISEKQKEVLLQAREEAERAEGVKRAEREAFEAWRDAKIAEKRAKKDFNIASC